VGFGYSCSQLAHNNIYDGRPFFAELFGSSPPRDAGHDDDDDDGVYKEIQNRNFPGWLVCPGMPSEGFTTSGITASCNQCIFNLNSSYGCNVKIDVPGSVFPNSTNCFIFNGPDADDVVTVPSPMPNMSVVNCEFALTNTSRARFYVLDQNWSFQGNNRFLFPDGIVQRTFPEKTRNLVEISRTKYTFTQGHKKSTSYYSYQLMDGESYPRTTAVDDNITLSFYYGSPSEWRYSQYPYRKVTNGFGFYSWISFLGGLSFFCYFTQVGVYALICKAMGWENDTASNYQSVA